MIMMDKISDVTRQDIIDVIRNGFVVSFDEPNMIVVAVVDADNDAHGKYLLSFQIFRESIINGGGEYVSLAEIFLRKLLRFCLSRLAIGSQNRTASGENSRCNKKAHPAFRQDARKIACGYFQANGINWYILPQNGLFFATLYRSYDTKPVDRLHRRDYI